MAPASESTTGPRFTAAVSAITDAFGDPTRRRIYLHTRDQAGTSGVTVAEVAAEVGVHPNVARHHLDKLAAGGYVEVAKGVGAVERRAGRPSKRYVAATVGNASLDVPIHGDDLVLALLGQALDRLPHHEAEAMAEDVGATYGRAMAAGLTGDDLAAGQRSLRSAMQAVADALTAHGFAAHMAAGTHENGLRIINDHCPFGTVATDHPVICAVDRGMVRGMLSALYADPGETGIEVATEASKARGDTMCATAV
ncbi:MAG: helix-turn-helix transcriptional regulator [Ilumatobacteraceae bacterium]